MSTIHIHYDGNSEDIELNDLIRDDDREQLGIAAGVALDPQNLTGDQMKRAVAYHYDKPVDEFNELSVEFHKNGNVTIRPQATFGKT